MKVSKFMTPKVITAGPEDGIRQTYFRMKQEKIRHIPVVCGEGNLLGLVSDRDLRRPEWVDEDFDTAHQYDLSDDLTVRDLMTTDLKVVYTYDSVHKANKLFLEHRFGAMPVLNKDKELVGILSMVDMLKALDHALEGEKA